ncbi:helix-turn-helix domain-containing protein [Nocardia sp. NBC_01730]|uniref:helix-turn-helix domain-containing protein n=1 Tax=Nocardia sp. NBC_01730 TaxID=2975998 RepID=UPI002E11AE89|nr:helix-turn-helix domain-containing protein [Nocardia sp. NBC_01730]
MSTKYTKWSEVKAKARELDPRTEDERAAGVARARGRRESYVRGHQLAEIRKAIGLTQTELAGLLDVSQARISKIESGEIAGIDTIRAYVAALGGKVDVVVTLGDRTWKVA